MVTMSKIDGTIGTGHPMGATPPCRGKPGR